MKKKARIVWFYLIISAFSFVLIFGMRYLGQLSREQSEKRYFKLTEAEYKKMRKAEREQFSNYGILEDLEVRLQSGEKVNLKEKVRGKVVVFAQYFAECPQCMGVNFTTLKELLLQFPNEDFCVVTVNVRDVEFDKDLMKYYDEKWAEGDQRWLFAHTPVDAFNKWSQKNLGFAEFYDAEGEEALIMPVKHDMGIAVIGRDLVMVNKEDIFSAQNPRDEGFTAEQISAHAGEVKNQLVGSVEKALRGELEKPPERSRFPIILAISAGILVAFVTAFMIQKQLNPNTSS